MKSINFRLTALLLVSAALIGYELAVMRTFSVGSWSNFGAMVLSIALLGFGLAGTLLTFLQNTIKKDPEKWLRNLTFMFIPAMTLAHLLAQLVPFKPILISVDFMQVVWVGVYYLIYAIPFFIGAMFINIAFTAYSKHIHQLYFWNMFGSGIGGIFILVCMYFFPPEKLILPLLFIGSVGGLLLSIEKNEKTGKFTIPIKNGIKSLAAFIIAASVLLIFGQINVSEYKGVSYIRKFPEYNLDHYSYSPTGEYHVYDSSYLHFAPGLSDAAALNVKKMPENAFKGLYIDGSGPIGIMRELAEEEARYIDFLPMSAPYKLKKDKPKVLIMGLGGATGVFTALYQKSEDVHVVESNPALINIIRDIPVISQFNGNILNDDRVTLKQSESRSYCVSTDEKYDILEISLIDSVGYAQAEPYPIHENYTYTVEAISDYMHALKDDGILSLTTWDKLKIPRNVPKLLTTVVESLKKQGVENPGNRVFIFNLFLSTATVLVKNSDFTDDEITTLRKFCRRRSFKVSYYPGMTEIDEDFSEILKQYKIKFGILPMEKDDFAKAIYPRTIYHHTMFWLLNGKEQDLYDQYVFNIRPATDNRPYYTAYLKPENITQFAAQIEDIPEEWGYLLLLGTLFQSIIFGILIILIPLFGKREELFKGKKGTGGIIVYYACLGLAYMMIEIFLIQRLVHFLGDPIFSVSVVITSMLIISGLGSLFSKRFSENRSKGVRFAVIGIALTILFYIFFLTPVIDGLIGLPFFVKALIAILCIAPAAFFMGMPFPSGLSSLGENRPGLLPWAFGMNGALSVTGSNIAKLISISSGFSIVLILAMGLYILAGVVFPANTLAEKKIKV